MRIVRRVLGRPQKGDLVPEGVVIARFNELGRVPWPGTYTVNEAGAPVELLEFDDVLQVWRYAGRSARAR